MYFFYYKEKFTPFKIRQIYYFVIEDPRLTNGAWDRHLQDKIDRMQQLGKTSESNRGLELLLYNN